MENYHCAIGVSFSPHLAAGPGELVMPGNKLRKTRLAQPGATTRRPTHARKPLLIEARFVSPVWSHTRTTAPPACGWQEATPDNGPRSAQTRAPKWPGAQ